MKVIPNRCRYSYAITKRSSIDLTMSENPLGPSPKAIKAIQTAAKNSHFYPANENDLISCISKYYGINEECILLGAGAKQLLEQYLQVLAIGKNIVLPTATFPEPIAHMSTLGGSVCKVALNTDFSLNLEEMLKSCNSETALIHICNPNNPTGIWTDLNLLTDLAKKMTIPLLVSEAGADFVKKTLISLPLQPNIIVVRSFSKAYGLAGLRIGYSIASPEMTAMMKSHTSPYQVSSLAAAAAIAAMEDIDHLNKSVDYAYEEKAFLVKEMTLLGFKPVDSQGQNFIAEIPQKFLNASQFCHIAKNFGIAVVNCELYPGLERYIRISPKLHGINKKFVMRLKELLVS